MKAIFAALCVGAFLVVGPAIAEQAAAPALSPPMVTPLGDEPVSGNANLHAVTISVLWPYTASTGKHTHPGDEYGVVLEGEIAITTDGQGTRVYRAGDTYHNARGAVHEAHNNSGLVARSISVLIVDKGVPFTQPVK